MQCFGFPRGAYLSVPSSYCIFSVYTFSKQFITPSIFIWVQSVTYYTHEVRYADDDELYNCIGIDIYITILVFLSACLASPAVFLH